MKLFEPFTEFFDSLVEINRSNSTVLPYEQNTAAARALEADRKMSEQIRNEIGRPLGGSVIGAAKATAEKTIEVINPGQSYLQPALERAGVPAAAAFGIGLGVDIVAPGPGELSRFKGTSSSKSLFHGTTKESAQKIRVEGFKVPNKNDRVNVLGGASEYQFPKSIYLSEKKGVAGLFSSGKAVQILEQKELFDNASVLRARTEVPYYVKERMVREISKKYPEMEEKLKNSTSYTGASKIIDDFANNFPFVDKGGEVVEVLLKPGAKIYRAADFRMGKDFKPKSELIKEGYDGTVFEHTRGKGGIGKEYIIFNPDVLSVKDTKTGKLGHIKVSTAIGIGAAAGVGSIVLPLIQGKLYERDQEAFYQGMKEAIEQSETVEDLEFVKKNLGPIRNESRRKDLETKINDRIIPLQESEKYSKFLEKEYLD